MSSRRLSRSCLVALACTAGPAFAQTANIKPPIAQAWIDVATFSGMGMPMGGLSGDTPLSALGSLFGGGATKNAFGHTQTGSAGRWVDVTLHTRNNPTLASAQQAVPTAFLTPALRLEAPLEVKGRPPAPGDDEKVVDPDYEKPKGRLLLYWGCGAQIRPGQPKVLDMATATVADLGRFFVSRRATQRGAHSAPGRPQWPNPNDPRMVPEGASLVGAHAFSGAGVPEDFRFQLPPMQDLMPPLKVRQASQDGANQLTWADLPTARAYFIAGMGAGKDEEMVLWTSSELPDTGFGLTDYQTNAAVDRWLREKVLLPAGTTQCTVPKGVFPGEGGMLRMIAYGNELNLVHPPRPTDPKAVWEPNWALKVRVKSVASLMPGMPDGEDLPTAGRSRAGQPGRTPPPPAPAPPPEEKPALPKALDLLRGILGR
jgi:hypothetical protein